jgi:acyl-CoA thioester hydrolase
MDGNKVFETQITVRFRDLDALGHVNNAVFFTYFEEGRKRFFQNVFHLKKPSQFNFILARITCDFLRPVQMDNAPVLRMDVSGIGEKSFHFRYELAEKSDPSLIYARGESVQVCYDYKIQQTVNVAGEFREKLAEFFNESEL